MGGAAAAGIAGLAGCTSSDSGSTETDPEPAESSVTETAESTGTSGERTVTDAVGRSVTVPGSVDSVVGLGSGALRFITYAGGAESVVAVEQLESSNADRPFRPYTLANQRYTELPTVGTRKSPNPERVLQADPDVVVYGYATPADANELQSRLGIPVVVIRPGGLTAELRERFFGSLDLLGTVLGTTERVETLRTYVEKTLADLQDRAAGVDQQPRGYVGYLGRGKHGFTFTQPSYVPFQYAAITNVAEGATGNSDGDGAGGGGGGGDGSGGGGGGGGGGGKGARRVAIDPETLIQWDPEVVFVDLGTESYDALEDPQYQDVAAIENEQVYATLPSRDYGTNFGTVIADAYAVGAAANPDAYDLDPVEKVNEIYETFVGEPVYDGVADAYGNGFGRML